MKRRWICWILAVLVTVSLLPVPTRAAEALDGDGLCQQIKNTYRAALRRTGRESFNGFCGAFVNNQTYLLGIDTCTYGCDGKNEFDLYSAMGTTSGGYGVKSYPASVYSLREALDQVTFGGRTDAYNLLVGFQRTNTKEGSIYGHAVLIHGIVDGTVYFMECYATSLGGQYRGEGTPIACSVDTFCEYYESWTVFDGVVHFTQPDHTDVCKEYPAAFSVVVTKPTAIYAAPGGADYTPPLLDGRLDIGVHVAINGMLEAPDGSLWCRYLRGRQLCYAPADSLLLTEEPVSGAYLTELSVPTVLRRGNGFSLKGSVRAENGLVSQVTVSVYAAGETEPIFSGTVEGSGAFLSLNGKDLNGAMTFRKLPAGSYTITVTAKTVSYLFEQGSLVPRERTALLWKSAFPVAADWSPYATLTFQGNGGTVGLAQTAVKRGTAPTDYPTAARDGFTFAGWALDAEGTQPVTEDTVFSGDITLYARWTADEATPQQGTQNSPSVENALEQSSAWLAGMEARQFRSGLLLHARQSAAALVLPPRNPKLCAGLRRSVLTCILTARKSRLASVPVCDNA